MYVVYYYCVLSIYSIIQCVYAYSLHSNCVYSIYKMTYWYNMLGLKLYFIVLLLVLVLQLLLLIVFRMNSIIIVVVFIINSTPSIVYMLYFEYWTQIIMVVVNLITKYSHIQYSSFFLFYMNKYYLYFEKTKKNKNYILYMVVVVNNIELYILLYISYHKHSKYYS